MKILFVVDAFRGGAGNVIQILAREFMGRGYNCVILLTNGKIAEPKYHLSGIQVIDHKLEDYITAKNAIDRIVQYKNELKKMFHTIKPDAIISFLTTNNILSCMANDMKVPLIVSERIDPFKTHIKPHWRLLRRMYYGRANNIVVQCSNFAEFCGGRFKKNTVTIANPILLPEIDYKVNDTEHKIVFISIGRITDQKNYPWMCDQIKAIHEEVSNIELRIYGNGDQEENLKKYISDNDMNGYVKIMGYTDNPYGELAKADIYLMTSDYEGFPNSLSEAMAVGLPSVSRMCHVGIKDLVKYGVNGYLTEMDDRSQFVEICVELALDCEKRKSISYKAKSVSIQYSVEKITDCWENLLLNCKSGRGNV